MERSSVAYHNPRGYTVTHDYDSSPRQCLLCLAHRARCHQLRDGCGNGLLAPGRQVMATVTCRRFVAPASARGSCCHRGGTAVDRKGATGAEAVAVAAFPGRDPVHDPDASQEDAVTRQEELRLLQQLDKAPPHTRKEIYRHLGVLFESRLRAELEVGMPSRCDDCDDDDEQAP